MKLADLEGQAFRIVEIHNDHMLIREETGMPGVGKLFTIEATGDGYPSFEVNELTPKVVK